MHVNGQGIIEPDDGTPGIIETIALRQRDALTPQREHKNLGASALLRLEYLYCA